MFLEHTDSEGHVGDRFFGRGILVTSLVTSLSGEDILGTCPTLFRIFCLGRFFFATGFFFFGHDFIGDNFFFAMDHFYGDNMFLTLWTFGTFGKDIPGGIWAHDSYRHHPCAAPPTPHSDGNEGSEVTHSRELDPFPPHCLSGCTCKVWVLFNEHFSNWWPSCVQPCIFASLCSPVQVSHDAAHSTQHLEVTEDCLEDIRQVREDVMQHTTERADEILHQTLDWDCRLPKTILQL